MCWVVAETMRGGAVTKGQIGAWLVYVLMEQFLC